MTLIVLLIVIALTLAFFEALLPGGILGAIAALSWLGAMYLAFAEYGIFAGFLVGLGTFIAAAVMLFFEFKLLSGTRFGNKFFLAGKIEGRHQAQGEAQDIIGKRGESLTRLNPSGMIRVNGKRYEARTDGGFLDAGEPVDVISQDSFRLIVKKAKS